MAITLNGSTGVTAAAFVGDGSALTGTAPPTDSGAVGTYALLRHSNGNTSFSFGSTYGGSVLRPTGFHTRETASGGILHNREYAATQSGTWRCMGSTVVVNPDWAAATIFVRIS